MSLAPGGSSVNRLYSVAVAVLVLGLVLLGAALAPTLGCEPTSGLALEDDPDAGAANDPVVNASELPDGLRNATRKPAGSADPAPVSEAQYKEHLADRPVRVNGTVYATSLVPVETCGGPIEDALFVLGSALATLGVVALATFALYSSDGPPLSTLHLASALVLVLGVATFTGGVAAPAGCQDNYALETADLGGAEAEGEPVVDVADLPADLQNATQRSVTSNRTAFVDRSAYREHLEGRNVRFEGTVYDADVVLVQDCGGDLDDALLVVGLVLGTVGAVALALLFTFDHGEKVL